MNPDDIEVTDWVIEDGKGKEHEIEVIYGDGLISIKDDFIPGF